MARRTYEVQIGERYGSLVVTEIGLRAEPHAAQRARGHVGARAAMTLCDCGRTRLAEVGRLVVGKVRHCGNCRPAPVTLSTNEAIDRSDLEADPNASASPAPRRSPRGGRPPGRIDTSAFEPVMAEALVAYALDSGLLEQMLKSAVNIGRKRKAWTVRAELRRAEAEARASCESSSEITECVVTEPCSTGACPFAKGDHAELLGIPPLPRKTGSTNRATRPQPRPVHVPGMTYTIEAALQPLIDLRTERGTLDEAVAEQQERSEIERRQRQEEQLQARRAEAQRRRSTESVPR